MRRGNGFVRVLFGMMLALVLVLGVCGGVGAAIEAPATAREVQELRNKIFKLEVEIKNSDATQKLQIQNSNDRLEEVKDWVTNRENVSTYWYYALMFCSGVIGLYMAGIAAWFTRSNKQNRTELKAETKEAKEAFDKEISATILELRKNAEEHKQNIDKDKNEFKKELERLISEKRKQLNELVAQCNKMQRVCEQNAYRTGEVLDEAELKVKEYSENLTDEKMDEKTKEAIKDVANRSSAFAPFRMKAKAFLHECFGEYDKAITIWKAIAQENPKEIASSFKLAQLYSKRAQLTLDKQKAKESYIKANNFYEKATLLLPDNATIWTNWGNNLIKLASLYPELDFEFLNTGKEKCKHAEAIKEGSGAYNLSCIAAMQNNLEECKQLLTKSKKFAVSLPPCNHIKSAPDLDNIRNHPDYKDWFQDFVEQVCQEEQEAKAKQAESDEDDKDTEE
ncbi:hypothetical protein [Maridesulfovibrio salexigens]|uniref:TPR repeat-containing protein n=1 Tax=Maridesulfovibrio salexigens (strain ATCC 14822 / DSM 2638 / NCIMB 8403 / VKM B-1763) TaxID=526222 RepID=C6BXV0_MARSD|nr:hypothetical protein [Maridesulfovibrio salexigens]ACS78658.1 hypothetical protein Desal_0592 [Maridesulfovibrio salexigens DSM 2638]